MKKRYSISQKKCEQGLVAFYSYVAELCNIENTEDSNFDCTRICVTKPVQDSIIRYYSEYKKLSDEEIGAKLLQYGPKANLTGDGYEVEVEDVFVIEG